MSTKSNKKKTRTKKEAKHKTKHVQKKEPFFTRLKTNWANFSSQLINRLLMRFVGLIALFYIIWSTSFFQNSVVAQVAEWYASAGGFFLKLMGQPVMVINDVIQSPQFSIGIKNGCDGIEGLAIFLCSVLIYPTNIGNKLKGLLAGFSFLVVLNLTRIVSLYLIGIYAPSIFDVMHVSIWQVLFIMLTLVALFIWIKWVNKKEATL